MHLTRAVIDTWAAKRRADGRTGDTLVKLSAEDTMDIKLHPRGITNVTKGPAIVILTVYRDDGWSVREMSYETPETIHWETL